jgi:glycosyltransferase involved in cell wall biosynthesis
VRGFPRILPFKSSLGNRSNKTVRDPLVSIVVSAYNRPAMLQSALASIAAQTYSNLEVIVQDDSTNQQCEQIVREFADPRVTYTHNSPALGTAANLLAGYRKVTGKYFCTLNDDDLYTPTYVESMVRPMENNPAISVAFSDHVVIDAAGRVLDKKTLQNTRRWRRDRLAEGIIQAAYEVALVNKSIPAMFAMFRRAAIDLNDFPLEVASGYDFWLSYLAVREGCPIYYSPKRLALYRSHDESQTSGFANPTKRLTFARYSQYIHERFLGDARLTTIHSRVRAELALDLRAAGFALLRLGRNAEAIKELRRSFTLRPSFVVFIGLLLSMMPTRVSRLALGAS